MNSDSALISLAEEQNFIPNLARFSGVTVVIYSYMISIEDESTSRKNFKMALVYAGLRYGGIFWSISKIRFYYLYPRNKINVLNEVSSWIIIFLLQGMMALRVYILFGKSRRLKLALGITFATVQCINILNGLIWVVDTIRFSPELSDRIKIVTTPLVDWAVLLFEVIMCIMILYYTAVHLKDSCVTLRTRTIGRLATALIRGNMIYFLVNTAASSIDRPEHERDVQGSNLTDLPTLQFATVSGIEDGS
ncbi:hypothetical protein CONPUDRAFT_76787 [Coniophora puteana RWD-64-598 SS2]|uniref:DUF300-domain-containing protein n=1 Tax=Coniophora puteana (strain RWD-64-598) TaxID=741705 RepID=A0A5M3MBQ9_CONPW|nr:uncharacterized protein CONPUDRAFT_76787 [Coniophora puteana RWD-64-598 SS2]EIW76446.1 hypothetical protein CONPUDRAFT_76787 [Coniophora puteana RWD-64-598 SS2]